MHIVLNPNSDYGEGYVRIDTARHLIYGYNPVHRIYQGMGQKAGFSGHFSSHIRTTLIETGTFSSDDVQKGIPPLEENPVLVFIHVPRKAGHPILLRAASSFIGQRCRQ